MDDRVLSKQAYDFAGKNPNDVLTRDEFEHFDEGMSLKNNSRSAALVDFGKAAQVVSKELDMLLS